MDLIEAAQRGDAPRTARLLATGTPVDAATSFERTALHWCALGGHAGVMRLLLQAGASPLAADGFGRLPLHEAAWHGSPEAIRLLLDTAPEAATTAKSNGALPLHSAALRGNAAAARLLVAMAPQAAAVRDHDGWTPLRCACLMASVSAQPETTEAVAAIQQAMPPAEALADLAMYQRVAALQPLFADLAARAPLTPEQWRQFPAPCAGLGAALPAVLRRSEAEAALLVARLPAADRERLRTAALCLGRCQQQAGVSLPLALAWHILALGVADAA